MKLLHKLSHFLQCNDVIVLREYPQRSQDWPSVTFVAQYVRCKDCKLEYWRNF